MVEGYLAAAVPGSLARQPLALKGRRVWTDCTTVVVTPPFPCEGLARKTTVNNGECALLTCLVVHIWLDHQLVTTDQCDMPVQIVNAEARRGSWIECS